MPEVQVTQEDAERFLLRQLKANPRGFAHYGYGVYLPQVIRAYIGEKIGVHPGDYHRTDPHLPALSPVFYAAAWELCRRGILRPGISSYGRQATDDGSGGNGYSLTPWGEMWLAEHHEGDYVPTDPVRFVELLKPFEPLFGPGFMSRGNEAVRCYGAHAYLACCVMCGAAVESILLALAIKKLGNEEQVLKEYVRVGGRTKIEGQLAAGLQAPFQEQFRVPFSLLKYWRDESGHGRASKISEIEAYTSLALVLRAAQLAKDHYATLTRS